MRRHFPLVLSFAIGFAAGLVARPAPDPRTLPVPDAVTVLPPGGPPVDLRVYRYHDSAGRSADLGPPPDAGAWQLSFQNGDLRYHIAAAPVTGR